MKIMTFNMMCDFPLSIKRRWNLRRDEACSILNNSNCDIIGTQEITNNMFKDIKSNIKSYNIVGKPRTKKFFAERNDILISKKYEILKSNTFWLSKTPEKKGSSVWYSVFPRICTAVVIRLKDNSNIVVCNCHLDCFSSKAREYGLKRIMNILREFECDMPIILMGDFNALPGSSLIQNLINGKYTDKNFKPVQSFNEDIYLQSTIKSIKRKPLHIDYIFVSEEFEIKSVEIIKNNKKGIFLSDHSPLVAEVELK